MKRIVFVLLLSGCGSAVEEDSPPPPTDAGADTVVVVEDTASPPVVDTGTTKPETAVDAAAPPCTIPGAVLCEDFESGKIDAVVWSKETNNATMAVETERRANGKYALHLRVDGPKVDMPNEAALHPKGVFPIAGNHLFGRAMVFVERNLPDKNFVLAEATGKLPDGTPGRYGVGGMNPGEQLFRLVYHPGDFTERSTSHPPVGRWACWEWEMDGADDQMRVWLDGGATAEAKAMNESPPWKAPEFRDIAIGFRIPHPDSHANYDVWIDDIVIGTKRPGCPK